MERSTWAGPKKGSTVMKSYLENSLTGREKKIGTPSSTRSFSLNLWEDKTRKNFPREDHATTIYHTI